MKIQSVFIGTKGNVPPLVSLLTISTLGEILSRRHFGIYFFFFSHKTGSGIACKLYPLETICMKCQNLFSGEKKKTKYQVDVCSINTEKGKG